MKKVTEIKSNCTNGFSLIELLAVLAISTLLIISAIGVFSRMQRSVKELNAAIETQQLPGEILQRIAEDLDRIIAPVSGRAGDTKISITNKLDELFQTAQMKITRTYYDNKDQKQVFDEIIWQGNYDFDANGLVLYRSHSGLTVEDKLLDEEKTESNRELFIPVAAGLTYFKIEALTGGDFVDRWAIDSLPKTVRISLSFASPYRDIDGKLDVMEDEMTTRTIAVDRTKKIKFQFIPFDINEFGTGLFDSNTNGLPDFNDLDDFGDFNEPNLPVDKSPTL